jgi:hypothetical protein
MMSAPPCYKKRKKWSYKKEEKMGLKKEREKNDI